jgi:hypothetical protein
MKVKLKSILFCLILLTLTLGTAELICYVTFKHFKKKFTFFDFNKYFADEIYIRTAYQTYYHPERGWDFFFPTKFGERPRSIEYNKSLISTFGDSNTYCGEVKNNETWEERLSMLLQENIYNFGVGGYGTDQAYLKFLSIFPKARTPIVILGLITENINRIVNVYRPFYSENTGIKLTKPRFILKQDRLLLLPNPVRSLDEIRCLRNTYFLSRIGQNDFWFNRDRYPEFRFPYLRILFNKRIWLEIIYSRGGNKVSDINPRPYANLWEDGESTALMFKILESFIANIKDYDAVPIIMILSDKSEAMEKFKHKECSIAEKKILGFCRDHNILVFDSIGALANRAHSDSEIESFFFNEHISSKGNQIIAEALYNFLKDYSLSTRK